MKCGFKIPATIAMGHTRRVARRGLLICALFSLVVVAVGGRASAGPPVSVSFIEADDVVGATANHVFVEGVFQGTIGTESVSGTTAMDVRVEAETFHCTHTWTASDGSTLVIHSDCNMMTLNGQWRVVYGDGIFANFFAEGSLYMDLDGYVLDGVPYNVAEIYSGTAH
jgi:hypothetical protein